MTRARRTPERLSLVVWRRSRACVIGLGLLAAVLMLWLSGRANAGEHDAFTAQGFVRFAQEPMAPDFTLPDLEGTPRSLHGLKGQVVVLVFWTTW